jgi:hypothetical protein
MQRRLCSAILLLEAIVVGLSTPVLISVQAVDKGWALGLGLGLAALCVVTAGLLRHRWALALGWAVQVAEIALGFLVTAMFVLGAIFLALWVTGVRLGATIERDQAARAAGTAQAPDADPGPLG